MEEFVFQGRIAICQPRKKGNMVQHGFSGVMLAPAGQPHLSDAPDWENIQCEIIIRPIARLGVMKIKNTKLDHAALALADESAWEKPKKK
jgi:hypothetical protein